MNNPLIKIGCVANLYSRMMHFEKEGDKELGHTHQFNHLTLLASGSLKVIANGKETVFKAPNMIYIHKNIVHELISLEDNTVAYCIHALRNGEEVDDIIDPETVPDGVDILKLAYPLCQV
jgi:quercetin dioxygenase-like cupin family protein